MADQDAQDINQMMSASPDVVIKQPQKSKLLWVVLGCVVVGVGLGVVVYQQSLRPPTKTVPTPKPDVVVTPKPSPIPSVVKPGVSEVTPVTSPITFPKSGKLRVYHTLNNIQAVLELTIGGVKKTITLPAQPISTTTPANFGDATFDVQAGTSATLVGYLNSTSGVKLRGWIPPQDSNNMKECGAPGAQVANNEIEIAYIKSLLVGETIFEYQCWEDDDVPGEFNDIYMVWTYAPGSTTTVSPSPSPSSSPTASVGVSPSPSASAKASASPSPSAKASATASPSSTPTPTPTPTPNVSPRVTMPDTSEGTPVTGVFEVTVGTISVGLILLLLGLVGLLAL